MSGKGGLWSVRPDMLAMRKQLRKMIIRKPELLRMNILSILSILPPRSSLWKVKMLKVFKMFKETTAPKYEQLAMCIHDVPGGC